MEELTTDDLRCSWEEAGRLGMDRDKWRRGVVPGEELSIKH